MSDTETKKSSFLITDYYSIKANKTKRKNCQRDSSVLASDSYVFFFPSHIEKLPVEKKYISKVILHFVFCLFAWFLNFDLDLFCMILHLLCFLYVCLLVDFQPLIICFIIFCVYFIVFCLFVCECVCMCEGVLGIHEIILVGCLVLQLTTKYFNILFVMEMPICDANIVIAT